MSVSLSAQRGRAPDVRRGNSFWRSPARLLHVALFCLSLAGAILVIERSPIAGVIFAVPSVVWLLWLARCAAQRPQYGEPELVARVASVLATLAPSLEMGVVVRSGVASVRVIDGHPPQLTAPLWLVTDHDDRVLRGAVALALADFQRSRGSASGARRQLGMAFVCGCIVAGTLIFGDGVLSVLAPFGLAMWLLVVLNEIWNRTPIHSRSRFELDDHAVAWLGEPTAVQSALYALGEHQSRLQQELNLLDRGIARCMDPLHTDHRLQQRAARLDAFAPTGASRT